jgi:hypothetical protein
LIVFRPHVSAAAAALPAAAGNLTVHPTAFENCPKINRVSAPDSVVAILGAPHADCLTLDSLPPRVKHNAFKIQIDTYFWSFKMHCNTDRLSRNQREWVKSLLTVGSRIRLHWRPFNRGPRSEPCFPTPGHPPLPCIMNDIWLRVLTFVTLGELAVK